MVAGKNRCWTLSWLSSLLVGRPDDNTRPFTIPKDVISTDVRLAVREMPELKECS